MIDIVRWKQLRELEKNNPAELERIGREVGKEVGIIWTKTTLTPVDVLFAENCRDYPELKNRIDEWIK